MYKRKYFTSYFFFFNCLNAEIDLQISVYRSKAISNDVGITSIKSAGILEKQNYAQLKFNRMKRQLISVVYLIRVFFSTITRSRRVFTNTIAIGQRSNRY